MMKIVVIGGSGLIGTKVVEGLRELGHETVAGSSRSGVNAVTGEGLAEALAGADVVVDVMNSPSFEDAAERPVLCGEGSGLRIFRDWQPTTSDRGETEPANVEISWPRRRGLLGDGGAFLGGWLRRWG